MILNFFISKLLVKCTQNIDLWEFILVSFLIKMYWQIEDIKNPRTSVKTLRRNFVS